MKKIVHGDVIIKSINQIPSDTQAYGDSAVQYGEITGHSHRLYGDFRIMFRIPDMHDGVALSGGMFNGTKYIEVGDGGATIGHEEHNTLPLPKGLYKCTTVREMDHFSKIIRRVAD